MTTSTNGQGLTTHEATVQTAAVAIQIVTINDKQMTLSVFRQLPVLETAMHVVYNSYDGWGIDTAWGPVHGRDLWGWVNYHPKEACPRQDHGPHLHLLMADTAGDEGRRGLLHGVVEMFGYDAMLGRAKRFGNITDVESDAIAEEWVCMFDELCRMPQLFIAV